MQQDAVWVGQRRLQWKFRSSALNVVYNTVNFSKQSGATNLPVVLPYRVLPRFDRIAVRQVPNAERGGFGLIRLNLAYGKEFSPRSHGEQERWGKWGMATFHFSLDFFVFFAIHFHRAGVLSWNGWSLAPFFLGGSVVRSVASTHFFRWCCDAVRRHKTVVLQEQRVSSCARVVYSIRTQNELLLWKFRRGELEVTNDEFVIRNFFQKMFKFWADVV